MQTIELAPYRVNYIVSQGTGRRYTYLRFRSDMVLEVVVPRGRRVDPESEIKRRRTWVLKSLKEMSRSKRILDEGRVMFDGSYLAIVFRQDLEREVVEPNQEEGTVVVRAVEAARVKELVRRWFLKETSRYVVRKLAEVSARFPKYQELT